MSATGRKGRLKGEELRLLKILAQAGGDHAPVVMTSREAGEKLEVSQQAADRYLVHLAELGFPTRALAARRQRLLLTPQAVELLRKEFHGYRRIFEGPSRLRFTGTVVSGLGEGRYYLSQPGYVIQFSERLGYQPYPGTLNVRLPQTELLKVGMIQHWNGVRIDGFQASGRTFGGATCHPARLKGHPCHLIVPDRSHYKDVVEFIAPEFLLETLHLRDLDQAEAEVEET